MRLNQSEYRDLAEFRYALRRFLHFSEEAARQAGIEPQQHQALLAIRGFGRQGKIRVGELAERLQIRHHSCVGLADRLAAMGLVARMQANVDRREVFIRLTPQGSRLLEGLASAHREELRQIGSTLRKLLSRL